MKQGIYHILLFSLFFSVIYALAVASPIHRSLTQAVQKEVPSSIQVDVRGQHVTLTGTAASAEEISRLEAKILSLPVPTTFGMKMPGVASVDTAELQIPEE